MMARLEKRTRGNRTACWLLGSAIALLALSLMSITGCGKTSSPAQAAKLSRAEASATEFPATPVGKAITQAGKDDKYSFVLFYRPKEQASEAMRTTFASAKKSLKAKAVLLTVDINAKAESELITKVRAQQAPLPLTLVIAPNGATVRAFTKAIDEKTLASAFVSPKVAEVAKALQDKKVVAISLQNSSTKHNTESAQAAAQFIGDKSLKGQAVMIHADPKQEAELLRRCGIRTVPTEATIVLLAPPGTLAGTFSGATTKDALLKAYQACSSGSCSSGSCGPSGCN